MEPLVWLLKSSVMLAAAAAVAAVLARASASLRHQVWLCALLSLLLLPVATKLAPAWRPAPIAAAPQSTDAPVRFVMNVVAGSNGSPSLGAVIWWTWAAGAALLLARELRIRVRGARLVIESHPHPAESGVRLSGAVTVPAVHGVWNPAIVLPSEAEQWDRDRLDLVLRHERMHLKRRDPLSLFAARCVAALWWPQPLVWYALARLVRESEQAADDGVLAQGARASEYATHLVDIARRISIHSSAVEGGIPMIHVSELERRLKALLNPTLNRRPAARGSFAALALAGIALLAPVAALRAPAQSGAGIGGVIEDASGARVARARIIVSDPAGGGKEYTTATEDGSFTLAPLTPGAYDVEVLAPGFARLRLSGVEVKADQRTSLRLVLNVGGISERLTVTGTGTPRPSAEPTAAGAPQRLKIGGNVQASKLVSQVRPIYPPECKAAGVEGTVLLKAVIGTDGSIVNLERVNKLVDDRLAEAAMTAVRQWRYEPTLLNGNPVEVLTEIEINYTLAR